MGEDVRTIQSAQRQRVGTERLRQVIVKVPKGGHLNYDDDEISVYDDKGREVERGIYDDSSYKGEDMKWNERDGNYDLRHGYKLVVR